MPGGRRGRADAREQLVPKGDGEGISSSSPTHQFPRYELPLPGTLQPSADGVAPALTVDFASTGGIAIRGVGADPTTFGVGAAGHGEAPTGPQPAGVEPSARPAGMPSAGGSSTVAAMEIQEALLSSQPAPAFEHPIPLGRRRWMVFMFCLVAALLFADQNLLAPNMTAAAEFFGMDARQKDVLLGGALMAAFFAVGAPAALLVGWLTDKGDINRRTLLFWVVVIGETPCLLTYWVKEYWQFFLLRALTGIAVGGCFPLVFSLLGDLFPPRRRAAVSAVVQISTGAGLAVGQALSGSIGPATNWRVPFVVVAAPSLAVALLMLFTTREPPRGAFEEALRERYAEGLGSYEGSISWAKVLVLLRCPSNVLIILQGLPGSLPWGMVLTYFNDFLSQQKGFSVQAATLVLLMFGAGGALGVISGGAGGQWLYNRRKEYQPLLAGACVLLSIGPLYALVNADLQRLGLGFSCFLSALGGAVASVAGPNLRSIMLNVNEPETRGVALALQSMTDDLGKGLGPVLVAGLIRTLGREGAFNVATAGWVPCGFLLSGLACCMRRDEAAMQSRLARSSEAQAAAADAAGERAAGTGGGITVPMPLLAGGPGSFSDGGVTSPAGGAVSVGEERRLAKIRLLAGGPGSSASSSGRYPLPLSSSASEVQVGVVPRSSGGFAAAVERPSPRSSPLAAAGGAATTSTAAASVRAVGEREAPQDSFQHPDTRQRAALRPAEAAGNGPSAAGRQQQQFGERTAHWQGQAAQPGPGLGGDGGAGAELAGVEAMPAAGQSEAGGSHCFAAECGYQQLPEGLPLCAASVERPGAQQQPFQPLPASLPGHVHLHDTGYNGRYHRLNEHNTELGGRLPLGERVQGEGQHGPGHG